ncbi:DUF4251 domain-containing protein [uncultured Croceitalea sp.]|uniref:DUF4251 domain-containing protein n=1 Tax=uncultured Croceitalea sp. TaxID=1798908 RepID=UPI00374EE34A
MKILKTSTLGLLLTAFIFLVSCGSSKVKYTDEDLKALRELVDGKNFEIESDWAYPLPSIGLNSLSNAGFFPPGNNANQINLIGNANYLRIEGDSVKAQLPYYGERQISSSYGSNDTGILLNGLIKDLIIDFNEKKKRYELRFQANQDVEIYQVAINIFPNRQAQMNINSTHRTNIAYRGDIKTVE